MTSTNSSSSGGGIPEEVDFVSVNIIDLDGVWRSKNFTKNSAKRALENGLQFYCAINAVGMRFEMPTFDEVCKKNFGNEKAIIDKDSFIWQPIYDPQANAIRVGHILAEMTWFDENSKQNLPFGVDPRVVAKQALSALQSQGYLIYSGTELEFKILHQATLEQIEKTHDGFSNLSIPPKCREFLMKSVLALERVGIKCDYFNREYCHSQMEVPLSATFGIKSADNVVFFKHFLKEMGQNVDYVVTFMTKPFLGDSSSGAHFNFSLWDLQGKVNVLYDENGQYKLSDIGRWWLAGMIHHLPALVAICSPTVNCYRRFGGAFAPVNLNWGIECRTAAINVKNNDAKSCYFENRLPSGAANPYLVMAAVIYAGLDGIERKLNLVEPLITTATAPKTLKDALNLMEGDEILMKKLGIGGKWFLHLKREADVALFEGHDVKADHENEIEKERQKYLIFS